MDPFEINFFSHSGIYSPYHYGPSLLRETRHYLDFIRGPQSVVQQFGFMRDPQVWPYCVDPEDYNGLFLNYGIQCGHGCPKADFKNDYFGRRDTHFLSSTWATHQATNNGPLKKIEKHIRLSTFPEDHFVKIWSAVKYTPNCRRSGPYVLPIETFGGEKSIKIPSDFIKVALWEDEHGVHDLEAFCVPHLSFYENLPVSAFHIPFLQIPPQIFAEISAVTQSLRTFNWKFE